MDPTEYVKKQRTKSILEKTLFKLLLLWLNQILLPALCIRMNSNLYGKPWQELSRAWSTCSSDSFLWCSTSGRTRQSKILLSMLMKNILQCIWSRSARDFLLSLFLRVETIINIIGNILPKEDITWGRTSMVTEAVSSIQFSHARSLKTGPKPKWFFLLQTLHVGRGFLHVCVFIPHFHLENYYLLNHKRM